MAIETKTVVTQTCDYCKKVYEGQPKNISFITGHVGQGTDWHECTMKIRLTGLIPYGTGD